MGMAQQGPRTTAPFLYTILHYYMFIFILCYTYSFYIHLVGFILLFSGLVWFDLGFQCQPRTAWQPEAAIRAGEEWTAGTCMHGHQWPRRPSILMERRHHLRRRSRHTPTAGIASLLPPWSCCLASRAQTVPGWSGRETADRQIVGESRKQSGISWDGWLGAWPDCGSCISGK